MSPAGPVGYDWEMSADDLPNASDQELLEFFWCDPVQIDSVVAYTVTDQRGIELRFSFDIDEGSIQTTLSLDGEMLEVVSHERLAHFRIFENRLIARCEYADGTVKLEITVRPNISVRWWGLITREPPKS